MTSRDATLADAEEIKELLSDFLGLNVPIAKMRSRIEDPGIITTIDPGVGYCQIKVRRGDVKVEALFPRGVPVTRLRPILDRGFQRVLARFPMAGPWRVWAQFWDPKGADGRFDGGEGEVRAWAAAYPRGVVDVVPPTERDDAWTDESTIERLLA